MYLYWDYPIIRGIMPARNAALKSVVDTWHMPPPTESSSWPLTITGATWTTTGRHGKALLFNGVDALVTFDAVPLFNLTTGMTLEAFEANVLDFLNNAQDARFKRPYKLLTYQPMVELVHTLQGNGFQVYITTGGGRDFVRAICEEIYNIPRSMTIGSSVTFQHGEDAQGVAQVLRTKEVEQPIDDGPGKPVHIHRAIGRRPIMAAGNSDGDIHMLKYATGHTGLTLGLLVHHDDPEREYAYGPASGLPDTKVGTFSQALYDVAKVNGWIVISMKNDWKRIFGFETAP